jgi:hypothetical protein
LSEALRDRGKGFEREVVPVVVKAVLFLCTGILACSGATPPPAPGAERAQAAAPSATEALHETKPAPSAREPAASEEREPTTGAPVHPYTFPPCVDCRRPRRLPPPRLVLLGAVVQAPEAVRVGVLDRLVHARFPELRKCGADRLARQGYVEGIDLRVSIGADGRVAATKTLRSSFVDAAVAACVERVFGQISFAPWWDGGDAVVTYGLRWGWTNRP